MPEIKNNSGFSLVEVLFSAAILAFALCGLLVTQIGLLSLGDISRQHILATNAVQAELEEIKNTPFSSLADSTFYVNGFSNGNARGRVEVSATSYGATELKLVRILVSFRHRGNRIVGEDVNLDGQFQALTEDQNGNNRMDSPVEAVTLVAK